MPGERSAGGNVPGLAAEALEELSALCAAIDADSVARAQAAMVSAQRIFVTGAGRSGLMAKAIAMRLMHIGLASYAAGEVATPALTSADLLLAFSARGGAPTVAHVETARAVGATVIAWTSSPETPIAMLADIVIVVPSRTQVPTAQHAGSLFEQGCLLLGDALCRSIQTALEVPTAALNERHSTLL